MDKITKKITIDPNYITKEIPDKKIEEIFNEIGLINKDYFTKVIDYKEYERKLAVAYRRFKEIADADNIT